MPIFFMSFNDWSFTGIEKFNEFLSLLNIIHGHFNLLPIKKLIKNIENEQVKKFSNPIVFQCLPYIL